jgi:predicted membrane channel-forming protein YqfA (hemolysin III family)
MVSGGGGGGTLVLNVNKYIIKNSMACMPTVYIMALLRCSVLAIMLVKTLEWFAFHKISTFFGLGCFSYFFLWAWPAYALRRARAIRSSFGAATLGLRCLQRLLAAITHALAAVLNWGLGGCLQLYVWWVCREAA